MAEAILKFKGDATHLKQTFNEVKGGIGGIGGEVSKLLTENMGELIGLGAAFEGIKITAEQIKEAINWGFEIKELDERLEIGVNKVLQFSIAARRAHVDSGEWATAIEKVQKTLVQSQDNPAMLDSLTRLGVTMESIKEGDGAGALEDIGNTLNRTGGSAQRTADLLEVVGRGGGKLVTMLKGLGQASESQMGLAHYISEDDVNRLAEAHNSLEEIKEGIGNMPRVLTAATIRFGEWVKALAIGDYHLREQEKHLKEMDKTLEKKQKDKDADKPKAKTGEEIKKEKEERVKAEKEIQAEKEKTYLEYLKIKEANSQIGLTDAQKLDHLDEEREKLQALVDTHEKAHKSKQEWSVEELKDLKDLAEHQGKISELQITMGKEAYRKNQLNKLSDNPFGDGGNALGGVGNLQARQISLGEKNLKLMEQLVKNTTPKTRQSILPPA